MVKAEEKHGSLEGTIRDITKGYYLTITHDTEGVSVIMRGNIYDDFINLLQRALAHECDKYGTTGHFVILRDGSENKLTIRLWLN